MFQSQSNQRLVSILPYTYYVQNTFAISASLPKFNQLTGSYP